MRKTLAGLGVALFIGACAGGARVPPEPKPSPRTPILGDSRPVEGDDENSEFEPAPCAQAAPGPASATTAATRLVAIARPGRLKVAAMADALLMSAAFSA